MKFKRKKKFNALYIFIFFALILLVLFVVFREKSWISILLAGITVITAIITFGYETHRTKNIAEAEFIVNLNSVFIENGDYKRVYEFCETGSKDIVVSNIDISNYLTFFETLQLLIDKKVIKIKMVDDLFGYRFFLVVHNAEIQKRKLIYQPENFCNIYKLEYHWMNYRAKIGRAIFKEENTLQKMLNDEPRYKRLLES